VQGLNQGGKTIMVEQRGSRRSPNQFYFDIKVEKAFKIMTKYSLEFSLDFINVPNADTNLFYASTIIESPSWMLPTDIIMPRRALLGVKFVF
jgi:hypothetical protein